MNNLSFGDGILGSYLDKVSLNKQFRVYLEGIARMIK